MKDYIDIELPREAADDYYSKRLKSKINYCFCIDETWYAKIFEPSVYFLLGSKGSGKTMYAAYLCADMRNDTKSRSYTIDVSDFGKLIRMKQAKHLDFTAYLTMWEFILLQKFLGSIENSEISFWGRNRKFELIQKLLSESFGVDIQSDRFNPVTHIDNIKQQSEVTEKLNEETSGSISLPVSKLVIGQNGGFSESFEEKNALIKERGIQTEQLIYVDVWNRAIEAFIKTFKKMTFKNSHFLFVDGLDVRPADIDTQEYSECIGSLVRAVYNVNSKILGNLFDDETFLFKVVALTRTDIFLNSELVNVTSKINDNCAVLNWSYHNEQDFEYSKLNKMLNYILRDNGEGKPLMNYFGFDVEAGMRTISAALYIQRYTRLRPRDFVNFLRAIQEECVNRSLKNPDPGVLLSDYVKKKYSRYYVDQIRSEMIFRYTTSQYAVLDNFLRSLRRKTFTEEKFELMVRKYRDIHPKIDVFGDYKSILNLLYSLDILGWIETRNERRGPHTLIHWHYREVAPDSDNYELPWDKIANSNEVLFIFHMGVEKEYCTYA